MADPIKFTLDGQVVVAERDETIWEVAKREGTIIPHLCHSGEKGYRPDGNCRACMVEVDGERTLVASCIRKPSEGMVVNSDSNRAQTARKMVMEMLVADQPKREVAHDKSSHFWDMADLNGVVDSRFPKLENNRIPLLDDSHVAMSVNLDACISCNLCVRACRDVQVNDVIGMAGRGHGCVGHRGLVGRMFEGNGPRGHVRLVSTRLVDAFCRPVDGLGRHRPNFSTRVFERFDGGDGVAVYRVVVSFSIRAKGCGWRGRHPSSERGHGAVGGSDLDGRRAALGAVVGRYCNAFFLDDRC